MKIYNGTAKKLVTPAEMQDGQIGIIRYWDKTEYIGRITQKFGVNLISLGMDSQKCWINGAITNTSNFQIEILPPGTLLEI